MTPILDTNAVGELLDETTRALADHPTTSLIQTDLDRFHELNVEAGREVGDRVLEAVLRTVGAAAAEEGWTAARIGGDEFALLAPGLPLEAAFLRGERLRSALDEAIAAELPDGARCTASVGVVNAPRDAKAADDLLRKAQLALHSAKEQGGDRVGLSPGDEMVLKSSYYGVAQLARLKTVAERAGKKESVLLREALDDLLRKYAS
jgi:diguanylate cyclase (GGDEF)-like protein